MLVQNLLEDSAARFPGKEALRHLGETLSYAEVEARANRLARALVDAGVRPGDRVALLYENSFHYVAAHFAIFKAGAVSVSLNTETSAQSLAYLLGDCEARAIFAAGKYLPLLLEAEAELPFLEFLVTDPAALDSARGFSRIRALDIEALGSQGPDSPPPNETRETDLASLVYTSGSTAKPKGVMLSHRNLVSNALSVVQYLDLTPEDRVLCVLPFHYIYGTSLLYTHFAAGGSVAIENRFAYPNVVLDALENTGATGFSGVPSTFAILLAKSNLRKRVFPRLRYVTQAGGAMAPSVQREAAEAFHPARLFIMYGCTEAAPRLTYLDPDALSSRWGSIGKAVPGVEVIVADEEGRRLPCGETGEIAARGPNIMLGYWKDPGTTAEAIRNGWYFTGDLGREDEAGFLFVSGRSKDFIKAGGNRVGAQEIEDVLMEMEGVLEAAVIGVADALLGEAIKAFVAPKEGAALDVEAVKTHVSLRLPLFKRPKWIEIREALPKNAAGKILKTALREEASAR
jgi:long-chain acyl-CoA synthetase